ncbi:MAG: hypothetical protein KDA31_07230 [Phycisphaerales bacterium]|nr:hypothetical protein [Phycisphaerales bacterium]
MSQITFRYESRCGAVFNVTPGLVDDIGQLIGTVTTEIKKQRDANHFIGYLSVPISPRGGGNFHTNIAMASHITAHVQKQFGEQLWILNPAAYNLPKIAKGGDYMAVWADILAGEDGRGDDFDMLYFAGPSDVWRFFGATGDDRIGSILAWLRNQSKTDPRYRDISDDKDLRNKFLKYYGLRGSAVYSKGAHDEWNVATLLNSKRQIGDDIAIYYNGIPIEPGDYDDGTDSGYEAGLLH